MKPKQNTLFFLFLLVAGLMCVSVLVVYWIDNLAIASRQTMIDRSTELLNLEEFLVAITDAETGQRGFVVTGQASYLEPYNRALANIQRELSDLEAKSRSGLYDQQQVAKLANLVHLKLDELAKSIALRKTQGLTAAVALVSNNVGMHYMEDIRKITYSLRENRQLEFNLASNRSKLITLVSGAIAITMAILNIGLIGWSFRRVAQEMDERELVNREVRQQKEILATTLSSIGDGVIVTDSKGNVTFLNAVAEKLTGWTTQDARGLALPAIFPIFNEDTHQAVENPVQKVLSLGVIVGLANHTILRAKNGVEIPIDDSAAPIRNEEGNLHGVVLVFRDFSERRRMEDIKGRLAAIVESSDDAIISKNLDGVITTWNRGAERLFGYTPDEAIGKSVTMLIPENIQAQEEKILERIRIGESISHYETIRINKNGEHVNVSLTISPLCNRAGEVIGASKISRDITEQKAAEAAVRAAKEEVDRTNARLEKTVEERTARLREMISELQQFSYAIVHDMRAPLRAMQGFATILEEEANPMLSTEHLDYAHRIITAANRLDKLIRDALDYNKAVLQELPLEEIDLDELLPGLIETYPNLHPDNATISIENKLPRVLGNEALLTQCFSNLLGNAVKFVDPGVRTNIRLWSAATGKSVKIFVQDNGIGIPQESQGRLFGMFQRLNEKYEGNGIGLAIVRKVTERMGGKVSVESKPGEGSCFCVELQLVEDSATVETQAI